MQLPLFQHAFAPANATAAKRSLGSHEKAKRSIGNPWREWSAVLVRARRLSGMSKRAFKSVRAQYQDAKERMMSVSWKAMPGHTPLGPSNRATSMSSICGMNQTESDAAKAKMKLARAVRTCDAHDRVRVTMC